MKCASSLLAEREGIAADPEAMFLLKAVRASCGLMLLTIENVLDLKSHEARASEGRLERLRQRDPIKLVAQFAVVLDLCRVACAKDIIWLNEREAAAQFPALLEGPRTQLQAALKNVLVACCRYAGESCAVIAQLCLCTQPQPPAEEGCVDVCATFTAVGRSLSLLEVASAFQPYRSSTGLALRVARASAQAMGGDVWLVSDADAAGARFDIRVRIYMPGAPQPPAEREEDKPPPPAPSGATSPPRQVEPPMELTERAFPILLTAALQCRH